MEDGKIIRWLKQEGDAVEKGEEILEIETEKVNVTLESPGSGILRKKLCDEGATVRVGECIAIIADANEDIQSVLSEVTTALPKEMAQPRREPQQHVAAPPVTSERQQVGGVVASPRARKLAREKGVDLSTIVGTGPGGRIVEEDILRAAEPRQGSPLPFKVLETVQLKGQRMLIADRMLSSLQTKAQVTLTTEADMTEAKLLRDRISKEYNDLPSGISYNDLLIRAVALTLRDHGIFNSLMVRDELRIIEEKNVGLAVATDDGLVVPVVKNADKLALHEIAKKTAELLDRARSGTLNIDDVSDGTFTITNLGMYSVDVNTAIINPPQTAILAVGRVVEKPVVREGKITPRHMMTLSLTFDHRVTDGVPAAKFLQDLKEILEKPARLLGDR